MKRYALIILILLTVMLLSTAGKETKKTIPQLPKFSTSVWLRIRGDSQLKDDVNRYISSQLRSLGDVQMVKYKPERILDIHAHRIYTPLTYDSPASPFGFSLSIVILKSAWINIDNLKTLSEGRINEKDRDMLMRFVGQTYLYPSHMAWSGKDLQALCQQAIKYFDTELVKLDRERHQVNRRIIKHQWEDEKERRVLREIIEKKKAEDKIKQ